MPQPMGPQDAGTFVGRARELAVLSAAWRQAAAGNARLALVSGEPGIGKTELARAFARTAAADGALVLWGSAWEDGGAPPYWPWVQVLRSYARQAGAAALAEAASSQAAVLAEILPEVGTASPPVGSTSGPGSRSSRPSAQCSTRRRGPRRWP
jgi:predicted ATPase